MACSPLIGYDPKVREEATLHQTLLFYQNHRLLADPTGALFWPEQGLLVVADLHLEKGSAFAGRGSLLPPYDTRATLARLAALVQRCRPRRVISLGDSFHDVEGSQRLAAADRDQLQALVDSCEWLWVTGNHDPLPPKGLNAQVLEAVEIGGLIFRHMPGPCPSREIAGHLHPKASLTTRGHRISRPCFVADRQKIILPAFGSYAGGLNVRHPALSRLFPQDYRAYLLGAQRIHVLARHQLERVRRTAN